MSKLSTDILNEFLKRGKFKSPGSVKNYISKIKNTECPHATQNAAAQVAAQIKGFSIAKKLKKEDKLTIPANIADIVAKYKTNRKSGSNNIGISTSDVITSIGKHGKSYPKVLAGLGIKSTGNEAKIAQAYLLLYITENALRDLIRTAFKNEQNWWNNRVNSDLLKIVAEAKMNYPYHGAERKDDLEYTHLGQLKEIIIAKKNWPLFDTLLKEKDKETFRVVVNRAIPSRNSIAHCTALTPKDLKVVDVRFNDILKMIK